VSDDVCLAHKEKQQLNGKIVIIHEFQLSETLKMLGLYLLGQNCLHLTFEKYLSSETYSRKYEKLSNIVIIACKYITEKNAFVENVCPANLALFIYVSTHCVETVKWLDYNRYCQLTRWCSGNASALDARSPGFNPRIRQGFFMFHFLLCCCCAFTFLSKTHYLSQKISISFTMLIYLVYLTYCKICDRL